jgi:hypothetical protein
MDVAITLASKNAESSHAQTEADKSTWFIERILHIHEHIQDILQKSNAKYKQHHDQHRVAQFF